MIGRTAVVTGAARGGGRGVAQALAGHVENLVLVGRSTAATPNPRVGGTLEQVADELRDRGSTVLVQPADLSRAADRQALVDLVTGSLGGCDLLVNNAAFNPLGAFLDRSTTSFEAALAVNVTAPAALCHAFLPGMLRAGFGRIVNIGSGAATTNYDGIAQVAYSTAKAAMERLSTALAGEFAGRGVAVSCVRVDEALRSEFLAELFPGAGAGDTAGGCTPDEFGVAVRWLLAQGDEVSGRVLTFQHLRDAGAFTAPAPARTKGRVDER
ncbi:SDR family NAD(P)-dependent oxidoreductase [Frankia canadensis]|uniref:SDR family NAD(P)-dependent oxidoreductase n=1 Tax=Frankia canadensis TaxID=1836972 RepID=UPI001402AF7B|nr:SDR family NAD(P)-dependent oxidoreductase [Frankia canadensis]